MSKSLRSLLILTTVLLPLISDTHQPAIAQERQGCFMVDRFGQLLDLSDICPSAQTFEVPGQPTLGTGDIQVTLRWTTTDDLDLYVTDPAGQTVFYGNRNIGSGGQLDVDANAACGSPTTSPIENIFWPVGGAPQGDYVIEVDLFTRCANNTSPISFELRILVQGNVQTITGSVDDQTETVSFPFSLPLRL